MNAYTMTMDFAVQFFQMVALFFIAVALLRK